NTVFAYKFCGTNNNDRAAVRTESCTFAVYFTYYWTDIHSIVSTAAAEINCAGKGRAGTAFSSPSIKTDICNSSNYHQTDREYF
ncbi:hypothetical protein OFM36_36305, partial [Escherichia coli]|nr:hypothetical protein [Escherichia coli]